MDVAMKRLTTLLGAEHGIDEINLALKSDVEEEGPPVVGGMHVTCADESELECAEGFQKYFVEPLFPELKYRERAPFRLMNLGGRYEWGAVRIAEQHFALPETRDAWKAIVVKVNSHVAVSFEGDDPVFGPMDRYDTESVACGALHGLLDGGRMPFAQDLRKAFNSEGKDRVAVLNDPDQVEPPLRALYAAVVNARMQAQTAILDIQDFRPVTPTVYVVVPCVTLNRPGPDTELLCGFYIADHRGDERTLAYQGLGDDPARYRLRRVLPRLHIEDD
jgi:hypothetical protein